MEADGLDTVKVAQMLHCCAVGDIAVVQGLVGQHFLYARKQDEETGKSPLMAAAEGGQLQIVQYLLDQGAPWNAVDRFGRCAGDFATQREYWEIVNLLVDHGTRAELILASVIRASGGAAMPQSESKGSGPAEHEPSTKPNYLRQRLTFTDTAILDQDRDAVMMQWEKPLMEAHAHILTENSPHKRVMNVGFGMGIIDTALQSYDPSLHIIIEGHPDVHAKMIRDGWDRKANTRICFGKWQDIIPLLIQEGVQLDGIFFDTYGEHFMDMEDFHGCVPALLSKPNGIYSFFNGLAPDNLFFHGVACQCVKLQLGQMGLETEFLECQIEAPGTAEWEGIRRKYWHNRDTYYLPRATWKPEFVDRKIQATSDTNEGDAKRIKRI